MKEWNRFTHSHRTCAERFTEGLVKTSWKQSMEQMEKSNQYHFLNLFFELPEKSEWPFDFCSREWIEYVIQTEMNKTYSKHFKKRNIMTELLRSHKDLEKKQERKERMQKLEDFRKHYSFDGDGHDYDRQKPAGEMETKWWKDAYRKHK